MKKVFALVDGQSVASDGPPNIVIDLVGNECVKTRERLGRSLGLGRTATADEFLEWVHRLIEAGRQELVAATTLKLEGPWLGDGNGRNE